ncbi:MAG: hypothetical protein HY769_05515 [Candidatus Stahlbacteria bacterium]|nr:hypothetical protein [Candidatus Stahlbacteria bacterium]
MRKIIDIRQENIGNRDVSDEKRYISDGDGYIHQPPAEFGIWSLSRFLRDPACPAPAVAVVGGFRILRLWLLFMNYLKK